MVLSVRAHHYPTPHKSHNTHTHSYLIIITQLLRSVGCDLAGIRTPADLRAYVLGNRAHIETILPSGSQRPYPKARGAFKCVCVRVTCVGCGAWDGRPQLTD